MIRHALRPAQRAGLRVHALLARQAVGRAHDLRPPTARPSLGARLGQIEANLAQGLLPFWTRYTWDESHGGFRTLVDRTGRPTGSLDKDLRRQARMIWMLAAAHRHGLSDRGYLELAARGVAFLTTRMWDARDGGFVARVGPDGHPVDASKPTVDQAFAVYALAEYALATGDRGALAQATSAFDVIRTGAEDGDGGFREFCTPDGTPAAGVPALPGPLAVHSHVMAALTVLALASGESRHAMALRHVRDHLLARAIDPRLGCARERFGGAGRTLGGPGLPLTAYGHNAQLAWMLLDATQALREPRESVRSAVLGLLDHALASGFDWRRGGLAAYGPPEGHVTRAVYLSPRRLHKIRWPQAEILAALSGACQWTGEARYLAALERELDWVWRRQIDHTSGDWFDATSWRRGRPVRTAAAIRDPFHDARALMRLSRELRAMGVRP